MPTLSRASLTCVHDDALFLPKMVSALHPRFPSFVFISRLSWAGVGGNHEVAEELARAAGATVVVGDFDSEAAQRRFALEHLREAGMQYALIVDSDEIVEPKLLENLAAIADAGLADRVYAHMDTYWKSPQYVVRPRERLTPVVMVNVQEVEHVHIREFSGGRPMVLGPEYGLIHHLSYAGPDERIQKKISTWSHRDEVAPDWYQRVWQGWDFHMSTHHRLRMLIQPGTWLQDDPDH